jgi:hypothetical protein
MASIDARFLVSLAALLSFDLVTRSHERNTSSASRFRV